MKVKRMITIALMITILFVQEQMLMVIPNVQLTFILLLLYSTIFKLREVILIIFVYVFIDNIQWGLNLFYMVPMIIGWSLVPISYNTLLNRTENVFILSLFGLVFGFVYGWLFVPFHVLQYGVYSIIPYLIADIPYELVMAVSNFCTTLWLLKPLKKIMVTVV